MKWVDQIGEYLVERKEGPRPGGQPYIPLVGHAFVLHTTEGSGVDSAVTTIRSKFESPHFVVGENRIVQMRPLDAEGATLRSHNDIGWQVEAVGFSKQAPHLLTPSTLAPLVSLGAFVTDVLGVPLARPAGWEDDCSDIKTTWAANNTRRVTRKAISFDGWVGHMDVPDQDPTWHWDPGAFMYAAFFELVNQEREAPMFADFKKGWKGFQSGQPEPTAEGDEKFGWNAAKYAASKPAPGAHTHVGYASIDHTHTVTGTAG